MEGRYGGLPAAVMVDSTDGWPVGPIFEGDEAVEHVASFVDWVGREPFRGMEFATFEVPDPTRDATDLRAWPESGVRRLVSEWRLRHLDEDGYLRASVSA